MSTNLADAQDLYRRFQGLPPRGQAGLRRVSKPDELRTTPGLYYLFPGVRPTIQQVRLAFVVPWCDHQQGSRKLGALCADKIAEDRIIRIARVDPPDDLVRFRRLIMQLHADAGWLDVAEFLFYWGAKKKRQLVEDYYLSLHKLDKGAKP